VAGSQSLNRDFGLALFEHSMESPAWLAFPGSINSWAKRGVAAYNDDGDRHCTEHS